MERVKGIEPSSQAWEARILPLNHTRFDMLFVILSRVPVNVQYLKLHSLHSTVCLLKVVKAVARNS